MSRAVSALMVSLLQVAATLSTPSHEWQSPHSLTRVAPETGDFDTRLTQLEIVISGMADKLDSVVGLLDETKQILDQTIRALAGKEGIVNRDQIRKKRDVEGEDNSQDDILSSLSLHDIIPHLSSCRDGRDGISGKDGINGLNGKDGRDGRDGILGEQGEKGDKGSIGEPGPPGVKGSTSHSVEGSVGPPGPPGETGLPGIPGSNFIHGSIYTRWGRTSCPGNTSVIYIGFMAGTGHTAVGGGVNQQCLPVNPEYNLFSNGGSASIISGAEYETHQSGINEAAHNQNVPCARCHSTKSAMMMLPGKRTCPTGWSKEYEGYLMTAHNGHVNPSTYECVDQHPEYIHGQSANTDGALLYYVKPDCDGAATIAHCPPYYANRQLTCVVCVQ